MSTANSDPDPEWLARDRQVTARFWERFGGKPDFAGADVLDLGCGHGNLCVDVGLSGARHVTGLDINTEYITIARQFLARRHPDLTGIVEYTQKSLAQYPEHSFDYILSKDSFEHIIGLDGVLREVKRCLKKGGKLYAGFGPLYNSYDGHHDCFGLIWPWGHLMLPKSVLLARASRRQQRKIASINDLLLNQLSFKDYRTLLGNAGLKMDRFEVNQSRHIVSTVFSVLRRLPFLEEYFTHNIYCILEKEE